VLAENREFGLGVGDFSQFLPTGSLEKGPVGSEFPCIFPAVQGIESNGTAADRRGEFSELLGLFALSLRSPKYRAGRELAQNCATFSSVRGVVSAKGD
jgi:hypothetical protein